MAVIRAHCARLIGAAGTALLLAAVIVIVIAIRAQRSAPQPPRSAASPVQVVPSARSRASATRAGVPELRGPLLPRSIPTHLSVPAIGVESDLMRIGLDDSGHIRTPPLGRDSRAYWLTVSPTPGELGPATIIGHVDSAAYGPAVFFKLGALRQRDKILVTRADGVIAVFEVERVVAYPKAQFPTEAVYGNLDHAGLRLITCGGLFDAATHNYESNIVAYASLVSSERR